MNLNSSYKKIHNLERDKNYFKKPRKIKFLILDFIELNYPSTFQIMQNPKVQMQ